MHPLRDGPSAEVGVIALSSKWENRAVPFNFSRRIAMALSAKSTNPRTIESSVSRLMNEARGQGEKPGGESSAVDPAAQRADHTALHHRLALLRTAIGEPEPPSFASAATAHMPTPAVKPLRTSHRSATALMVSVVLMAGLIWWVTSNGPLVTHGTVPSDAIRAPKPTHLAENPTPVAAAAAGTAPPTSKTMPAPAPVDEQGVRDMINTWRLDWSRRDVAAYLSHYSQSFVPAGGQTRAEWESARQRNITSRPAIRVEVEDLRVEPLDDKHVRLSFLQNYLSGSYQERAQPKTMLLVREDMGWQIAGEWQGTPPLSLAKKP